MIKSSRNSSVERRPSRRRRLALVLALAAAMVCLAAPAAHAANRIYWSNLPGNSISFANLDGTGGGKLPIDPATLNGPMGLAIDSAHGKLYWANYGNGTGTSIGVANIDGSGAHLLPITGGLVFAPHGVAVDDATGKLYWTNHIDGPPDQDWIGVANLDGSGAGYFNTSGTSISGPRGLALDPAAGRLYWADWNGNLLSYANLNGTGGQDLNIGTLAHHPEGVAVSPAQNYLFFGNFNDDPTHPEEQTIAHYNLDGSGGDNLPTPGATRDDPHGIAIDPANSLIYWANFDGNSISYEKLDGTSGGNLPTPGATLDGPNLPVLLKAPAPQGDLKLSGKPAPGGTLTCPTTGFAPDSLATLMYQAPKSIDFGWQENGKKVDGANGGTLKVHDVADYRCTETGTNAAGTGTVTSKATGVFKIGKPKLNLQKGTATLKLSLPAAGTLSVSEKGTGKHHHRVASASSTLDRKVKKGRNKLVIKAKGKAKRKLKKSGHAKVKATITFTPAGGAAGSQVKKIKLKKTG
jgi:DNA-binding beta-propeller fold protein YncE